MVKGYFFVECIKVVYLYSRIIWFDLLQFVLEVLSMGDVDGVLGDVVFMYYFIQIYYLLNLCIENFVFIDSQGFCFLFWLGDEFLFVFIDCVLLYIGGCYGDELLCSWSVGWCLCFDEFWVMLLLVEQCWFFVYLVVLVVINYFFGVFG